MNEQNTPFQQEEVKSKKLLIISTIAVFILVVSVIGFLIFRKSSVPKQSIESTQASGVITNLKNSSSFPIYSSTNPPSGFSLDVNSVSTQEDLAFFSYNYNGGRIVVTQQPRPPIMEEVKKVSEFDTPVGKAYIADLEGNITGFIVTGETLIIFSNASKNDSSQLEQLMRSFTL